MDKPFKAGSDKPVKVKARWNIPIPKNVYEELKETSDGKAKLSRVFEHRVDTAWDSGSEGDCFHS